MSKYKTKNGGTPEVHSARSKLDGLLQTLVDKQDESSPVKEEPETDTEQEQRDSVPNTPTKRPSSSRSSRKKKRYRDEPETTEMGQYHHTYVMKLFDRSVDLAQFEEDSSLYPICRAWMRNQPHNRNLAPRNRSPSPERPKPEDEDSSYVYELPSPVSVKLEPGVLPQDLRIPSPIPQPDEHLDIDADPSLAPPSEQLLLGHMDRWKKVRQKWKDAGQKHEAQYMPSMKILKDMFDHTSG